jgi:cytoskeletal protein CcmA (bactofilin family)
VSSGKKRRNVQCPHCDGPIEVGGMTISTVCPSCMKTARVEDLKVDTYWAGSEFYTAGSVTVEPRAVLVAKVRATRMDVDGEVKGPIHLREGIHIGKKGRVVGDVRATSLKIDEGAVLIGRVEITPPAPQGPPAEPRRKKSR